MLKCTPDREKNWVVLGDFTSTFCLRAALVTMDETWLNHYGPEIKQQSVEWWHSVSPRPKKFRVQKSADKVLASFFGIKTASSSLSSKGPKYQCGVYSSLLVQLKDILKEKCRWKVTKVVLFL